MSLAADAASPERAWIGLGANLGDGQATLAAAVQALQQRPGVAVEAVSPLYRSEPVDAGGPPYWNAVARLRTTLTPPALLEALLEIEHAHGRQRPYHHAPRTLDLDLLLQAQARCDTPSLTLPHPRLHRRAFVLRPLLDLDPDIVAPGLGRLADAWPEVRDQPVWRVADAPGSAGGWMLPPAG